MTWWHKELSTRAEGPLAHAQRALAEISGSESGAAANAAGDPSGTVRLTILPITGLACIRASAGNDSLANALESRLALGVPGALQSTAHGDWCLRWIAPDEWWLSGPIDELDGVIADLRDGSQGHRALVDVSAGYQCLQLSGSGARSVLARGVPYDLHAQSLPPGKVVGTLLGKTEVRLRCIEPDRHELIVRRSYADYVWLWLQQAARGSAFAVD